MARHARGLVVVAEEHRDEFKAVAQYLNDMAELDRERGISVWLVEAKAVRNGDSPWAPLFTAVIEPNAFSGTEKQARTQPGWLSIDRVEPLLAFCFGVANAYQDSLASSTS